MSIEKIMTLLTTAKFDAHFGRAPDGTQCPYIVLTEIEQPNFAADNKVFQETTSLRLRLVEAEVHNWTLIDSLKSVLDNAMLPYSVTYVDDEKEHICETYFDIRYIGGIK